jgi:AcrR family transcriptional regulator/DNA-binding MarR family transcriptional regulator
MARARGSLAVRPGEHHSNVHDRRSGWGEGLDGAVARAHVAEIQRSRLLAAAVGAADEFGYADTTVAHITARARVSRRTFYDLFSDCDDCLSTMLGDAQERITRELAATSLEGLSWHERVRQGLWAILSFFDREPVLARVCVVGSAAGSESVLERRAELFARLASVIEEGRGKSSRGGVVPALTAEGLVGAAHAILYERLLKRSREPFVGLLGPLMGMIVLPYLGSAASRREQSRPAPGSIALRRRAAPEASAFEALTAECDPLQTVPMRLTYRTALVLECIACSPGISNRMVGEQAGVSDQGQISKLLSRLDRLGLVLNTGEGHAKGEANAWTLTPIGRQFTDSVRSRTGHHKQEAA